MFLPFLHRRAPAASTRSPPTVCTEPVARTALTGPRRSRHAVTARVGHITAETFPPRRRPRRRHAPNGSAARRPGGSRPRSGARCGPASASPDSTRGARCRSQPLPAAAGTPSGRYRPQPPPCLLQQALCKLTSCVCVCVCVCVCACVCVCVCVCACCACLCACVRTCVCEEISADAEGRGGGGGGTTSCSTDMDLVPRGPRDGAARAEWTETCAQAEAGDEAGADAWGEGYVVDDVAAWDAGMRVRWAEEHWWYSGSGDGPQSGCGEMDGVRRDGGGRECGRDGGVAGRRRRGRRSGGAGGDVCVEGSGAAGLARRTHTHIHTHTHTHTHTRTALTRSDRDPVRLARRGIGSRTGCLLVGPGRPAGTKPVGPDGRRPRTLASVPCRVIGGYVSTCPGGHVITVSAAT
jgi:hypothetical protein